MKKDKLKRAITEILGAKLPNGLRVKRVIEELSSRGFDEDESQAMIDELVRQGHIKKRERASPQAKKELRELLADQSLIELVDEIQPWSIKTEYKIGKRSIARHFGGSTLHAEDINEIGEALKEYIDEREKTFQDQIKTATSQIYKQMIGIFGVFVSIFAILVISTDKMLRFDPSILDKYSFWDLLIKSTALFIPVGIVVALLIFAVTKGRK